MKSKSAHSHPTPPKQQPHKMPPSECPKKLCGKVGDIPHYVTKGITRKPCD